MLNNLYTTKMSMEKKMLEKRFLKICSSSTKVHKVMAMFVTTAVIIMMLCANVVMAMVDKQSSNQYIIEVRNDKNILDFVNKPFVENNTVYFPLRETFDKFKIMDNKDSYIVWDNGKLEMCVAFSVEDKPITEKDNNIKPRVHTILTYYRMQIGVPEFVYNATKNLAGQDMSVTKEMINSPILLNGVTYVPFEYLKEINIKHIFVDLAFAVKDNKGNIIYELPYIYKETVPFNEYVKEK